MTAPPFTTDDDFWDFDDSPPPPPKPAGVVAQAYSPPTPSVRSGRPKGHPFRTELDLGEINERHRLSQPWTAKTLELSRAHVVVLSRRMLYTGRKVLMSIHLIDARPTPLAGQVVSCEYDAEGLYRIDIDLIPIPQDDATLRWFAACWKK